MVAVIACVVMTNAGTANWPVSASTLAFDNPTPTLDDLKPGGNSFAAHGGDVMVIRAQSSGGNTTCHILVPDEGGLDWIGEVERHAYDRATVLQIHQDGTYTYSLPEVLDETGSCSISVRRINRYEQLMLDADELGRQRADLRFAEPAQPEQVLAIQQKALDLYQQAIALEPQYPHVYKQRIVLLLDMHVPDDAMVQLETIEQMRELFLSWSETLRQDLATNLQTLAQIYETSPEWLKDPDDDPRQLRGFAEFVRTGEAPAELRTLLESEEEQTNN
ncbi:MAG: hypothetical protein AAF959_18865 [Cyanobacteria bacterium P01_D01_bin.56]